MDILKELRLRRWARENFVSVSQRSIKWHPIVLDEMRLRDEEISDLQRVETDFAEEELVAAATDDAGAKLVPLLPDIHRLDPPQLGPTAPHFMTKPVRESVAEAADWGFYYG